MSFEGVFEKWLKGEKKEECGKVGRHKPPVITERKTNVFKDKPGLQHNVLGKEIPKTVVSISPKQPEKGLQFSVTGDVENKESKDLHCQSCGEKNKNDQIQTNLSTNIMTPSENNKPLKQKIEIENPDHRLCQTHSTLTDLQNASPSAARSLRVDRVFSPEYDALVEPDSTSEYMVAEKGPYSSQKCITVLRKVSNREENSPFSTSSVDNTPTMTAIQGGGVMMHLDYNQSECDSTGMYLTSPSAISPASQGEIEERVCPVLTDHEDGASPAHCVCRCRSLPPPVLSRDHVPITTTATLTSPAPSTSLLQHTVIVSSSHSHSCSPSFNSTSPKLSFSDPLKCEIAPDVEQLTVHSESKAEQSNKSLTSETVDSGVLSLTSNDTFGRDNCLEKDDRSSVKISLKETHDPPALFQPQCDGSDVQKAETGSLKDKQSNVPAMQKDASKSNLKQTDTCGFAKRIDWKTAVAETLQTSSSEKKSDGKNKPSIILKIRTNAVVPCLERNLDLKLMCAQTQKRIGCSVDSSEIFSRLRKRQKPDLAASDSLGGSSEQTNSQRRANSCSAKNKRHKTQNNHVCSHSDAKRKRRNTVQLGDVEVFNEQFSTDCDFIESSVQLFRLQMQTYSLVSCLFPHFRQQLDHIAPDSHHFSNILDDIIGSLQCSDVEEIMKDFEHLSKQFDNLKVEGGGLVPVYSPQVTLCRKPGHSLQDFQDKVCSLLQLLLPDLNVSLTDIASQHPEQLEEVLKRVVTANTIKGKAARKCRV